MIVRYGEGASHEIKASDADTTNNRMELGAAIAGFEAFSDLGIEGKHEVEVVTDSQYLVKGMTEWISGWRKRGWKTAAKKPVLNRELWEALSRVSAPHVVKWRWVRGHAGHAENERCDELANQAMDEFFAR